MSTWHALGLGTATWPGVLVAITPHLVTHLPWVPATHNHWHPSVASPLGVAGGVGGVLWAALCVVGVATGSHPPSPGQWSGWAPGSAVWGGDGTGSAKVCPPVCPAVGRLCGGGGGGCGGPTGRQPLGVAVIVAHGHHCCHSHQHPC